MNVPCQAVKLLSGWIVCTSFCPLSGPLLLFPVCVTVISYLFYFQENISSLDRKHSLAANHQLLIEPVYQRCSSKWCCPSVLSHCLSLCTVNTVGDSWLHLKLWGHYILTCSLFTLRLPPIFDTPAWYLSPTHSVHHPLSGYIILCMHAQRDSVENTQPRGSVWFAEFAGWICLEKTRRKDTVFPWSIISFI